MRLDASEGIGGQARVGALMLGSSVHDGQRVDAAIIQCGHIGTLNSSAIAVPLDLNGCGRLHEFSRDGNGAAIADSLVAQWREEVRLVGIAMEEAVRLLKCEALTALEVHLVGHLVLRALISGHTSIDTRVLLRGIANDQLGVAIGLIDLLIPFIVLDQIVALHPCDIGTGLTAHAAIQNQLILIERIRVCGKRE